MATSGSTDFTVTRDEIIRGAMRDISVLAAGETPTADEYKDASDALNMMVKSWQAEDIGLWLIDTGTLTLVADQASYTIGTGGDLAVTKPLDVIEARFYNATGATETRMFKMSREEYYDLPVKTSTGTPTQFYIDRQLSSLTFYIWPVWDGTAADKIYLSYKAEVEDFDVAGNNPDFPKEWYRALRKNLAIEISPEFGVEPSPTLVSLAQESKFQASAWDREHTSVFFGVQRY